MAARRRSGAGLAGRVRRSGFMRGLLARLAVGYIRLVSATVRWRYEGIEHLQGLRTGERGFIAAVWHGRLFVSPTWKQPGRETIAMISNNRDGELIAAIVARFGIGAVRGSTYDRAKRRDKGGSTAYARAIAALTDRSAAIAITPDGPRGPRMRAQPGVAHLAVATGCPVLPVAYSASRVVRLRGWDRFMVPLPVGRGIVVYGEPLEPPAEPDRAGMEAFRRRIEEALNAVTERADRNCGRPPERPDPLPGERTARGEIPASRARDGGA